MPIRAANSNRVEIIYFMIETECGVYYGNELNLRIVPAKLRFFAQP